MAKRIGKHTVELSPKPRIISNAAVVGKKEGEGPMGKEFDEVYDDTTMGKDSWEQAESELIKRAAKFC